MSNQFKLYLEITSLFRSKDYNQDDLPELFCLMEQIHNNLSKSTKKNLLTINNHKCDIESYLCSNGGDSDCNGKDFSYPKGGGPTIME